MARDHRISVVALFAHIFATGCAKSADCATRSCKNRLGLPVLPAHHGLRADGGTDELVQVVHHVCSQAAHALLRAWVRTGAVFIEDIL